MFDPSLEMFVDRIVVKTVHILGLEDIRPLAVTCDDADRFRYHRIDQKHRDDRRSRTGLDPVDIQRSISRRNTGIDDAVSAFKESLPGRMSGSRVL